MLNICLLSSGFLGAVGWMRISVGEEDFNINLHTDMFLYMFTFLCLFVGQLGTFVFRAPALFLQIISDLQQFHNLGIRSAE